MSLPLATVIHDDGHGENCFGGEAVVGVVVSREVVARVFGFALRPDFDGLLGIVFVGKDEVHAFVGLAFVADFDFELVADFGSAGERTRSFVEWFRISRRIC